MSNKNKDGKLSVLWFYVGLFSLVMIIQHVRNPPYEKVSGYGPDIIEIFGICHDNRFVVSENLPLRITACANAVYKNNQMISLPKGFDSRKQLLFDISAEDKKAITEAKSLLHLIKIATDKNPKLSGVTKQKLFALFKTTLPTDVLGQQGFVDKVYAVLND